MKTFYYPYYSTVFHNLSLSTSVSDPGVMGQFDKLPHEIIAKIFEQLNDLDLFVTVRVCRTFNILSIKLLSPRIIELASAFDKLFAAVFSNIVVTSYIDRHGTRYLRPPEPEELEIMKRGFCLAGRKEPTLNDCIIPNPLNFLPPPKDESKKPIFPLPQRLFPDEPYKLPKIYNPQFNIYSGGSGGSGGPPPKYTLIKGFIDKFIKLQNEQFDYNKIIVSNLEFETIDIKLLLDKQPELSLVKINKKSNLPLSLTLLIKSIISLLQVIWLKIKHALQVLRPMVSYP